MRVREPYSLPRILFVLKWRDQPYCQDWGDRRDDQPLSSGLYNSARFVADMLAEAGLQTKLVHVIDGNDIHREIVLFGATHVVVEAFFCPPYKFDDLRAACPEVQFIIRNHSETPFLASEGIAFGWMLDYLGKPNVVVAPNAARMLADTRLIASVANPLWSCAAVKAKTPYLPNYYPVGDRAPAQQPKRANQPLDVGCFGAVRPLKNHMTQALGALLFAQRQNRDLRFHINGARLEMGGAPILKNLQQLFERLPNAELISHPWQDHASFKALVATMDIVSQVTFSETFNIVSADAVTQGVPIVASAEVIWADPACVADPTDARSIAAAMARVWPSTRFNNSAARSRAGLMKFTTQSRRIWLDYFHPRTSK